MPDSRPTDAEISRAYGAMLVSNSTYLRVEGWEPQLARDMWRRWKRVKNREK